MNRMDRYNDYIKPVIVLTAICLVVTAALAFVYGMTEPVIEKRAKRDADSARKELLQKAEGFDRFDGKLVKSKNGKAAVTECYVASNDAGIVVTVETKSFGGALVMMAGIDQSGRVTGVKVTSHSDTPGVGTKDMTPEYLGQYKGLSQVKDEDVKKDDSIDYVSGASVTGGAVHAGVGAALRQFEEVKKEGGEDQ